MSRLSTFQFTVWAWVLPVVRYLFLKMLFNCKRNNWSFFHGENTKCLLHHSHQPHDVQLTELRRKTTNIWLVYEVRRVQHPCVLKRSCERLKTEQKQFEFLRLETICHYLQKQREEGNTLGEQSFRGVRGVPCPNVEKIQWV